MRGLASALKPRTDSQPHPFLVKEKAQPSPIPVSMCQTALLNLNSVLLWGFFHLPGLMEKGRGSKSETGLPKAAESSLSCWFGAR